MGIFDKPDSPEYQADIDDLKARVARLEAAFASLANRQDAAVAAAAASPAGVASAPPVVDPYAEVRLLKQQDKKIDAIRLLRQQTGLGLKEAKDIVDGL